MEVHFTKAQAKHYGQVIRHADAVTDVHITARKNVTRWILTLGPSETCHLLSLIHI